MYLWHLQFTIRFSINLIIKKKNNNNIFIFKHVVAMHNSWLRQ